MLFAQGLLHNFLTVRDFMSIFGVRLSYKKHRAKVIFYHMHPNMEPLHEDWKMPSQLKLISARVRQKRKKNKGDTLNLRQCHH